MPAARAYSLTTCHTTSPVMPVPQTLPAFVTRRNILPVGIAAACAHRSKMALTQSGAGTVRMWPALP